MIRLLLTLLFLSAGYVTAQAREVYPLDDGWRFFFQHENGGDNARPVVLPHTWNLDALAGTYPYLRTQGNYAREIYIPREWQSRRIFLRFGGAQSVTNLFVNGIHSGEHRGGNTAFTMEITDGVRFGAMNSLLVVVDNALRSDLLPASAEHNLYGGIYRSVELLVTDATAVSPLYLGSDGVLIHPGLITEDHAEGTAEIHLLSPSAVSCRVTLTMLAPDGSAVFTKTLKVRPDQKTLSVPFSVDKPELWSPSRPFLYRFTVKVEGEGTADEVSVETGFRTLSVDAREGLSINGERLPVRGVALYYDRAGNAGLLGDADYACDLGLAKELGANALRSPAGPHGQELYTLCDREGVLVWIDLPFIRAPYMGELPYFSTSAFEENGLQQLREIIAQNMNHPSVAMWGLFSSLRPVDSRLKGYVSRLNDLAHAMDPARPTVACSNQNGEINFVTDLIVWRQEVGWLRGTTDDAGIWSGQLHCNWSDLRSGVCYGAEGNPKQQKDRIEKATLHTTDLPERRQTQFLEEYARQLVPDSLFWGVWIDQLADFGSARSADGLNHAGLVSFDRATRKDAFYLYKALWNDAVPTLHIAEKRWTPRLSQKQVLKVYASGTETPLMLIDGDTTALTLYAPGQYRTEELSLRPENRVTVAMGELRDSAVIRCGDPLKQPEPTDLLQTIGRQPTN